ncbi:MULTISPECIES: DUF2867 domain-containing protein [Pseudoalteromonas]|uniref:DUF2867 domain-containing protein n=1 Tax=Pseudoalteromonas obscura TaxID=3048491 RepID=A0ABT7EFC4_9GAMM|nr:MULTISPECIES: DUF2867 domain-containing protein [Pseudoalteromonas]MBQ4835780.1 DUF2867 domain-containing protein [Pseudoalteromonas luteoviolacea]MDK2593971.1 DUF2867 domain-containing protein [Pseudoalteromonas sp. P94(2023)]
MFSAISSLVAPFNDRLANKAQSSHFRDALVISRKKHTLSPSETQHAIFNYMPSWITMLMRLRNRLVKLLGFKVGQTNFTTSKTELDVGDQAGFVTVLEKYADEIICGAEDRHMHFYISVRLDTNNIIVSTLVNKKTLLGKAYVNAILPFHYVIARVVINSARKAGRI